MYKKDVVTIGRVDNVLQVGSAFVVTHIACDPDLFQINGILCMEDDALAGKTDYRCIELNTHHFTIVSVFPYNGNRAIIF